MLIIAIICQLCLTKRHKISILKTFKQIRLSIVQSKRVPTSDSHCCSVVSQLMTFLMGFISRSMFYVLLLHGKERAEWNNIAVRIRQPLLIKHWLFTPYG